MKNKDNINQDIEPDYESFSENDLKKFKIISAVTLGLVVLIILSIIVLVVTNKMKLDNKLYCDDTGLYKSVLENEELIISEQSENLSNTESVENSDIVKSLSIDVALMYQGVEFPFDKYNLSLDAKDEIKYITSCINEKSNKLNLLDLYPEIEGCNFISGDLCYTVDKLSGEDVTCKIWVTEESSSISNLCQVESYEIPEDIQKRCGSTIVGYYTDVRNIYDFISEDIYVENDNYILDLSKIDISSTELSFEFFETRTVNIQNLNPCPALRAINLEDRFTWIFETMYDKDSYYICEFKNNYSNEVASIKVCVEDDEISGIWPTNFE